MALYSLTDQQVVNIKTIMSKATILGTEVPAFVDCMNAFKPVTIPKVSLDEKKDEKKNDV